MNEPRPAPSNDKALGDVLMGDLSEPQARESVIKQTNRKILKLPRELRIEILSYVLRQGDTIKMKEGKISRERRKWNAEVERLKDPNWKRPGKAEAPGALLACREMYISGVETFWGGNTFSFANVSELQQFLGFATALAKKSLKSIDLFHHYRPSDAPIASGPTLQVLGAFVNLESIDIDTSFFGPPPAISEFDSRYKSYDEGSTAYYEPTNQTEANRDNKYWNPVLDPLKARDRFVNTIPPSALATLSTLQVRNRREPKPDVANILSYVRDLHKSDWSAAPFAPGEGSPSANVERSWNHQL